MTLSWLSNWLRLVVTQALALTIGASCVHEAVAADPEPIRPGKSFTIEFPELRVDRRGEMAKMNVRIPNEYDPYRLHPLFVWLGGGAGTSHYGPARRIADPDHFVLVGLPYPQGANDRRQRTMVGDFRRIWTYHSTMLNALVERVPNINSRQVVVGGFSNGAHCIDGYLKMRDPALAFNTFILAEGGGYRSGGYASAVRGKQVLVLWGQRSRHRSTGVRLAKRLDRAGMIVTRVEMQDTGHGFPAAYQEAANEWLLPDGSDSFWSY